MLDLAEFGMFGYATVYSTVQRLLGDVFRLTLPSLRRLLLCSNRYSKDQCDDDSRALAKVVLGFMERSQAPLEELKPPTLLSDEEPLGRMLNLAPLLTSLEVRIPEDR